MKALAQGGEAYIDLGEACIFEKQQPKNAQMLLSKANAVEIEPDCAAFPRLPHRDEILPSSFRFTSHVHLVNSLVGAFWKGQAELATCCISLLSGSIRCFATS